MEISVNGENHQIFVPEEMPLLWALRDQLNLTGTKYGCGHGVCGACIVDIDGAQAHACQMTCGEVQGKRVTTIEGQKGRIADALFAAWTALDVAQCGFCQPGQINSAAVLLAQNPNPSDDDIDKAMMHNLCRCATYLRVRKAIHQAAEALATRKLVDAI